MNKNKYPKYIMFSNGHIFLQSKENDFPTKNRENIFQNSFYPHYHLIHPHATLTPDPRPPAHQPTTQSCDLKVEFWVEG